EVAHLGSQDALHRPLLRGNDMNLEISSAQGSRDLETDETRADDKHPLRAVRRSNDRAAIGERAKGMDKLLVCSRDLETHGLRTRGKQEAIEGYRASIGQLHAAPFGIDGDNRRVKTKIDAEFGVEIVWAQRHPVLWRLTREIVLGQVWPVDRRGRIVAEHRYGV